MNKLSLLALVSLTLAACSNTPTRVVETRPAAPVVDAGVTPNTPSSKPVTPVVSAEPSSAPAVTAPTPAPVSNATTQPGGYLPGDGPGADVPPNLDKIADAAPIDEPLHPYANRPYNALGKTFTPLTSTGNYTERGIASWYGKKFHGQRTSNGDVYDMYGMTAAHPTLPIPSYARVTNTANKKSVVVRINDRGPFLHDRVIDLSYAAALKLDILKGGSSEVEIESLRAEKTVAALPVKAPVLSQPIKSEALPTTTIAFASQPNVVAPVGNIYLQLGAFKTQPAAEAYLAKMRSDLGEAGKLSLFEKDGLVRIHLGPYPNPEAAHSAADKLQVQLGFKPIVSLH